MHDLPVAGVLVDPRARVGANIMLMVTPTATEALASLLASPDAPGPGDDVVDAGLVEVFIDPEVSDAVEDQQLDVEVDEETLSFSLQRQSLNGGPPFAR